MDDVHMLEHEMHQRTKIERSYELPRSLRAYNDYDTNIEGEEKMMLQGRLFLEAISYDS